jgi:hypothetical protein
VDLEEIGCGGRTEWNLVGVGVGVGVEIGTSGAELEVSATALIS